MATAISQWLIFELAEQMYGFEVKYLREIVAIRDFRVQHMPQSPRLIEGVVLLRNQPIEIMEVRSALGLRPLREEAEEIARLLQDREEDHIRWLQELESCVDVQREFRLATDPHKCKFGQWYDRQLGDARALARFTNDDLALTDLLERLDSPHKAIHAIACQALELGREGRADDAKKLIDETRDTTLSSLRKLFARCREQIKVARSGLLFVLSEEEGVFGALVDRVVEVARFTQDQIRSVKETGVGSHLLTGVTPWRDTARMVQLLNVPALARLRHGELTAVGGSSREAR